MFKRLSQARNTIKIGRWFYIFLIESELNIMSIDYTK